MDDTDFIMSLGGFRPKEGGGYEKGVRYPEVEVQLSGEDGNAFDILGRVAKALRRAGVEQSEIDDFNTQATSGDYSNLLGVCAQWVTVL